jgi:multidrug efflux pump subunit AcrA (membrane-fusion protein)
VLVDVGDLVRKGQELVRLDPTFFQIEVQQRKADVASAGAHVELNKQEIKTAEAGVELAKAILADADLQLSRMKDLWEKPKEQTQAISKSQYDDAVFKRQQAAANLEASQSRLKEASAESEESGFHLKQAQEALRYAQERLNEATIRAPYDAVVTARLVDTGESVTTMPVTHLLEIQEIGTLQLEFSLPQDMLSQVRGGTPVEFEVEGVEGGKGSGEISAVYPRLDEATRSFRCRVLVENEGLKFRPGLLAQVRVVVREVQDKLVVPLKALWRTATGWQVVVSNEGHPIPRNIEVGLMTQDEAEVLSDLREDDQVFVPKSN